METSPSITPTNPFGLESKAATNISEVSNKPIAQPEIKGGDPFGLKAARADTPAPTPLVDQPKIENVPTHVADIITHNNLQELLSLGNEDWLNVDRSTLDQIKKALENPQQADLSAQLQGRIGAAELRLFSQEMK